LHRVADGTQIAGRVLQAVALARVHQGRRVRNEVAFHHHVVEGLRALPNRRLAAAVSALARGDRDRDPPAHFLRRLDDLSVFPKEVALAENAQGRLGPLADFGGTDLRQHSGHLLYLVVSRTLPRSISCPSSKNVSTDPSRGVPVL